MIETVKVSSRGQLVIPERVRNNLGITEGVKLVLLEKNKKLILEKETDFLQELKAHERQKEKMGWLSLAGENLAKIWDNPKDEENWGKYL